MQPPEDGKWPQAWGGALYGIPKGEALWPPEALNSSTAAILLCYRLYLKSNAAFMEPLPFLSNEDWKACFQSSSLKSPVSSPRVG